MMIMPNEESEWVNQVVGYIHSPTLFIQRDNRDFEAEKKAWTDLQNVRADWKFHLPIRQKGLLVLWNDWHSKF